MSHLTPIKKKFVLGCMAVAFSVGAFGISTLHAASPWFSGYLDSNNNYRYYAFTDWDTPLFGVGIDPDTSFWGIDPPSYRVDGHVIFEADGSGNCTVIESTGSCGASSWCQVGSVLPVSIQFSNWFSNPSSTPESDTRHDYNSQFINVVSGRVVPEPSTLALLGVGAIGLIGWAWRRMRQAA
jgi:hypothetical protein